MFIVEAYRREQDFITARPQYLEVVAEGVAAWGNVKRWAAQLTELQAKGIAAQQRQGGLWFHVRAVPAPAEKAAPKLSVDVKLSTGRTVVHSRLPNGAQQATPTPGSDTMTPAEWAEYCDTVSALNAKGQLYLKDGGAA